MEIITLEASFAKKILNKQISETQTRYEYEGSETQIHCNKIISNESCHS